MKIPIKQILLEAEIILEISALKARQMSLKAGIIPDHNTNWKGALKKVRGTRGELTSGRELNDIKQKMGFPENNVLQKLKSAENKMPREHEVAYDQKNKNIIKGEYAQMVLPREVISVANKNQVGFIHTHPEFNSKYETAKIGVPTDTLSGMENNKIIKDPLHGSKATVNFDYFPGDAHVYNNYKHIKFPIYNSYNNVVSSNRIYDKNIPGRTLQNTSKIKESYEDKISNALYLRNKKLRNIKMDDPRRNKYKDLYDKYKEDELIKMRNKSKLKMNRLNTVRFIVGKENYDKFNLNGEQIK